MLNTKNNAVKALGDILKAQSELLDRILLEQKIIHSAVTEKNWETLETTLFRLNELSDSFSMFEDRRLETCREITELNGIDEVDMYKIVSLIPEQDKKTILELFQSVRQKLAISKIKNNALNDYIRITREFLQGVFDSVIPQRRSVVYSRTGIVKSEPERLVLDTLL